MRGYNLQAVSKRERKGNILKEANNENTRRVTNRGEKIRAVHEALGKVNLSETKR